MKQLLLTKKETSYIKHYFRKEARLGIATIIILTLFVYGFLVPNPLISFALSIFGGKFHSYSGVEWEGLSTVFIAVCILAYILPLYVFRFLMNRSGNDLYLSLPIERKRLFYLHYIIGLIYLVVASFILLILYCLFIDIPTILQVRSGMSVGTLFYFILNMYFILLGCCLYTFFTYLVIRCHRLLDAIFIGIAYTVLPVLIYYAAITLCENAADAALISYGYGEDIIEGIRNFLEIPVIAFSIPIQMNLWVQYFASYASQTAVGIEILLLDGIIWIVIAIICYLKAAAAFERIRSEQSGQITDAFITYPLLIPLVTLLLLMFLQRNALITTATCAIGVAYMLANFIAKRKIAFSLRSLLLFLCLAACSYLLFFTLSSTKLFHTVSETPNVDEIDSVTIEITEYGLQQTPSENSMYYMGTSESFDKLKYIIEEHQKLSEYAQPNMDKATPCEFTVYYQYHKKNNHSMDRMYVFYEKDRDFIEALVNRWVQKSIIQNINQAE